MTVFLRDINLYLDNDDMIETLDCLQMFNIFDKFKGFTEECEERCFLALRQLQKEKVEYFFLENI